MDASIDACIGLLAASSDEKKFVGLLLATKLVKCPSDLARVFDVGLPFVHRLLATPHDAAAKDTSGDGSPVGGSYRSLALSVLVGFASDPKIALSAEFSGTAARVGQLLVDSNSALSKDELRDCAAVLGSLLSQPAGLSDPTHGRLLSSAVAQAAAAPALGPHVVEGATPAGAPASACALIEHVCEACSTWSQPPSLTLATRRAAASELVAAAHILCAAIGTRRDALALARLRALRMLIEAIGSQLDTGGERPANEEAMLDPLLSASIGALGVQLRPALAIPLTSKLSAAARADVLRAVGAAIQLCGPKWMVEGSRPPSPDPGAAGSATHLGGGALLSLLLQLCSVELQMRMHDQPADSVSAECLGVLPACCSILEEALFRLHSDAHSDGEDEEGGEHGDPWLEALNDEELVSAQQAFQRALMVCVDYLETLRTEHAERATAASGAQGPPCHALLTPTARLVSAWLAQPSAAELMDLYDRACSLLPLLRDAAASESAAWAGHLRSFERATRAGPPDDDDDDDAGTAAMGGDSPQETMAELFERMLPRDDPALQAELSRRAREFHAKRAGQS
jgi:hypothetical protein